MTDEDSRFSFVGFVVALVAMGVGTASGLALVPVVGAYLGTLVGGFVAGMAVEKRPLLEAGIAGVLAGVGLLAAGPFVGNGVVTTIGALGSISLIPLLVSTILSFAVGAFGAHFGDDLREGLTDPVEDSPAKSTTNGAGTSPLARTSAVEEQSQEEGADHHSEGTDTHGVEPRDGDSVPGDRAVESVDPEVDGVELERDD